MSKVHGTIPVHSMSKCWNACAYKPTSISNVLIFYPIIRVDKRKVGPKYSSSTRGCELTKIFLLFNYQHFHAHISWKINTLAY